MSILIKGMEMPDSCFHCKLAEVCQHYKAEHYANKRHEDCPLEEVPSAQPETARRIVGKSRDGMTLWYQCDMCNEPVDKQDMYCRGCGRRFVDAEE